MMCRSSAENMKTFRPTGRGRTAVHPQFGWHSLRCPLDSALYSAFPSCQGQAPVKQTAKECFPYRKGAFSFYLFLVPHKVPWVQDVELQGRDKSGLVVSCGKPVSCPHWGMPPTYLHFFTTMLLPVSVILGRDAYSEPDSDSSSFAGHRNGHFTDFVSQKPRPCQAPAGRWIKQTPLPSLCLRSAKRCHDEPGLSALSGFSSSCAWIFSHRFCLCFPEQWTTLPPGR